MDQAEWIELAKEQLVSLLDSEYAVTIREAEAKISEASDITKIGAGWMERPDPLKLAKAREQLVSDGVLVENQHRTRQGIYVKVLHLADADTRRIATKVDRASARKSLLTARWRGYSNPTKRYKIGIIGEAGERVLSSALKQSQLYRPVYPDKPTVDVRFILGTDLDDYGGPIDNAADFSVFDDKGSPTRFMCGFEVKNVRAWLGPEDRRVHRFLMKAAAVARNTDGLFLPVLVCRRRHPRLYTMGRELGFFSIQVWNQFVRPVNEVDPAKLEEVRSELGFSDLVRSETPNKALVTALDQSVAKYGAATAERWAETGCLFGELYEAVVNDPGNAGLIVAKLGDRVGKKL